MNKKRIMITTSIAVIILILTGIFFWIFNKEDKNTTLTLLEKQWIESNKNKIIDISLINNIPIFNYNGTGVFFDFLNDLEEDTKLDFNPLSYSYQEEVKTNYSFQIKYEIDENDILFYEDYYILVGTKKEKFNTLEEIKNVTIGVLQSDLEIVNNYLNSVENISFQTFETIEELFSSLSLEDEEEKRIIDYIAIPRTIYLKEIIEQDYSINYGITDLKQYYVLTLGDNDKLNGIIRKYASKWHTNHFLTQYNMHFNQNYLTFNQIEESLKAKFRSKQYSYGFLINAPFDYVVDGKLLGYNSQMIKNFASLANLELELQKYNSITDLLTDFNENKLDFVLNNYYSAEYKMDTYETVSVYDEEVVVVSNLKNNQSISSLNSLLTKEVMVLENSQIAETLEKKNISIKPYKSIEELLKNYKEDSIIVIDHSIYEYYRDTYFLNSKVDYRFTLSKPYNFVIRSINDNHLFENYFNFYLQFINEKQMQNEAYVLLLESSKESISYKGIVLLSSLVIIVLILSVILKKVMPKKAKKRKKVTMSKANKLKYIDMLTSLKNRNYLNDNIEAWDETEVYPQTIIIVDLNNIAYINDNYGHAEGDSVIKEAANILIKNQIENSEIIRTNGNEFLIYLVGYDEKQVVSYMRKLMKELKELAHGFGAASGYSMINDAIKTIDDAVNEATLDMRSNKEELNN